jgi:hypothetical protein
MVLATECIHLPSVAASSLPRSTSFPEKVALQSLGMSVMSPQPRGPSRRCGCNPWLAPDTSRDFVYKADALKMSLSESFGTVKRHLLSQRLKGCYWPRSGVWKNALVLLLGMANISIGTLATLKYAALFEVNVPYDSDATAVVYLPSGKINFYLQMKDFNQSDLRYSKSISYDQLNGDRVKNLDSAKPLDYMDGKMIYPAGLLPNSFPQDQFKLSGLSIDATDITWSSEKSSVKKTPYTIDEVVPPPLWVPYKTVPDLSKDERFINWIYLASFPSFRKLWGRVYVDEPGQYRLSIVSIFPYGEKSVTFAEGSFIGTKNYFLSVGMICIGSLMLLATFLRALAERRGVMYRR